MRSYTVYGKEYRELVHYFQKRNLRYFLRHTPSIVAKIHRPWISSHHTKEQKVQVFKDHFDWLHHIFSADFCHDLYGHRKTLDVTSFQYNETIVSLSLRFDRFLMREGLLTLTLSIDGQPLYTLSFFVARLKHNYVAMIGGIQGRASNDQIKVMTKLFHGLYPRTMMMIVFQELMQCWGVSKFFAVTDRGHVFHEKGDDARDRIKTNYDQIWTDMGAKKVTQYVMVLPLYQHRKLENIPSHKRSMYKKRYGFIDSFKEHIRVHHQ